MENFPSATDVRIKDAYFRLYNLNDACLFSKNIKYDGLGRRGGDEKDVFFKNENKVSNIYEGCFT